MVDYTIHKTSRPSRWVVGITGASGSLYGIRLIEVLLQAGVHVHVVVTDAGWRVLKEELGWDVTRRQNVFEERFGEPANGGRLTFHPNADIGASIASGSYRVDGMIVMP